MDTIALPFVEKVHWGVHFPFSHVPEGVPLLMHLPGHVQVTPQVGWQILTGMSLSGTGKSVNRPKYQVATHCINAQKHYCDPPVCLPTLMKNMLAAMCKPCILLKHTVKLMSPPGYSVWLALSQSTGNQWGGHSPSVSECEVFNWLVSILTTS